MNNLQWYRHDIDSTLEFLVLIMESGQNQTATPPHPRLTASVDKDNKLVNLEIFPADVKDSAVYYCALQPTVAGNTWTPYKNLPELNREQNGLDQPMRPEIVHKGHKGAALFMMLNNIISKHMHKVDMWQVIGCDWKIVNSSTQLISKFRMKRSVVLILIAASGI